MTSLILQIKVTASHLFEVIKEFFLGLPAAIRNTFSSKHFHPSRWTPSSSSMNRKIPWSYLWKAFALFITIAFAAASLFYSKRAADDARKQLILAQHTYCFTTPEAARPPVCEKMNVPVIGGFSGFLPFGIPRYRKECLEASYSPYGNPYILTFLEAPVTASALTIRIFVFGLGLLASLWTISRHSRMGRSKRQRYTLMLFIFHTCTAAIVALETFIKYADGKERKCYVEPVERAAADNKWGW